MAQQSIKEKPLQSLDEFFAHAKAYESKKGKDDPYPILYRGQSNSSWGLETSLDRFLVEPFTLQQYFDRTIRTARTFCALSKETFRVKYVEIGDCLTNLYKHEANREFLVYLRHIGYPSPLLDWSRSPYVAAFFAYSTVGRKTQRGSVAIYAMDPNRQAANWKFDKQIAVFMPDVKAHRRHHLQQSRYSLALQRSTDKKELCIVSHEEAYVSNSRDWVTKYTLPADLRDTALTELNRMNVNAFSLFENEEGLASLLANEVLTN